METAVQDQSSQPEILTRLSVDEVRAQADLIQELMRSVMKADVHYGIIRGFGTKPSLYKPGAEKILAAFRIAVRPVVHDLSNDDEIRYRVIAKGYSSGQFVGGGVGECSTNEEKFKWRKAVCEEEWQDTPEDRRRVRWYKNRHDNWNLISAKQIRAESADQANTVLKIAKKRAMIDLCLTATAASDLFTQDIEDLEPRNHANGNGKGSRSVRPNGSSQPMPQRKNRPPEGNGNSVVDVVSRVVSKELENGGTKYGIKTEQNGWFSAFKAEVAEIAEQAQAQEMKVRIDFVVKGKYKNVKSISAVQNCA